MKRAIRLSRQAQNDIDEIWDYTAQTYNVGQAIKYIGLVDRALDDIEDDPERPTSRSHPEFGSCVRSYHISSSKKRSGARIRTPRHVIYYTLKYDDVILVLRILKDDMDAPRHLPSE